MPIHHPKMANSCQYFLLCTAFIVWLYRRLIAVATNHAGECYF